MNRLILQGENMHIEGWIYDKTKCPICGTFLLYPVVDVGFGLEKGAQIGPSRCESCGFVGGDCQAEECSGEQCATWWYCLGQSKESL